MSAEILVEPIVKTAEEPRLFPAAEALRALEQEPAGCETGPELTALRTELTQRITASEVVTATPETSAAGKFPFKTALTLGALAVGTTACSAGTWLLAPTPEASAARAAIGTLPLLGWVEYKLLKALRFETSETSHHLEILKEEREEFEGQDIYLPELTMSHTGRSTVRKSLNKFLGMNVLVVAPVLAGMTYLGYTSQFWGWILGVGPYVIGGLGLLTAATRHDKT